MTQEENTRNVSSYVLARRTNPSLRNDADWERLHKAEDKRSRRMFRDAVLKD